MRILTLKVLLVSWIILIVSCGTRKGITTEENNYSLADIRSAIGAIAGDPREVSQNQREYKSQYFSKKKEINFDPSTTKERAYAHFFILGERRPYEIKVIVYTEKKTKNGYEAIGEDRFWSRKISEELQSRLHQGRDGRNMIDDFRPF